MYLFNRLVMPRFLSVQNLVAWLVFAVVAGSLADVSQADHPVVLPNGNYVIGNCHAGPDQPLLIELEPKTKRVVWTLDRFEDFGNNVSNSQILGLDKPSIR